MSNVTELRAGRLAVDWYDADGCRRHDIFEPGLYVHRKGGLYFAADVLQNSTNGRENVPVVRYFSFAYGRWTTREYSEFMDGRFKRVNSETLLAATRLVVPKDTAR